MAGVVARSAEGKSGMEFEFLEKLREFFRNLPEFLRDVRAALHRPAEDGSGPRGIVVSQEIAGGEPTHSIVIVATRYPAWIEGIFLGTSTAVTAAYLFDAEFWSLGFLGLAVLLSSVLLFMPDLMFCREIDITSRYLTVTDSARYAGEKSESLDVREIRGITIERGVLGLGRRRLAIATDGGKVKFGLGLRRESLEWLHRYMVAAVDPPQAHLQSPRRAPADAPDRQRAPADAQAALLKLAQQWPAEPELRERPKAPSMPPVAAQPRPTASPAAPPPPSMPPQPSTLSAPPPADSHLPEPARAAGTKRTPSKAQSAALSAFNKAQASTQNRAKEEPAPAVAPAFGQAREAAEARAKAMRESPVKRTGLDKSRT